jgi:heterocyst specific transport system permease protein
MISNTQLAWLQLRHQRIRFAVAVAGVAFASTLMLMQLGFMDALFHSAVELPGRLAADVVLTSSRYNVLVRPTYFPNRRLQQARAFPAVASVAPVLTGLADWKNPVTADRHPIFVLAADPARKSFTTPELAAGVRTVRYPDLALFDAASRPEFGPIKALMRSRGVVATEVNSRRIEVTGLFRLGTSFGIDGTILTSDLNYRRMFPAYPHGATSIGLVQLYPGTDAAATRDAIAAALPKDIRVLTKQQFLDQEVDYWATKTPIGFVFTFGVIMGVIVGVIIVYQILFNDVADHLAEYATLKAMGRTHRYLAGIVLVEATILALVGFIPSVAICFWLYRLTHSATQLPMEITPDRAFMVLGLTALMCWISGLIAVRKLRKVDPAEVF